MWGCGLVGYGDIDGVNGDRESMWAEVRKIPQKTFSTFEKQN